MNQKNNTLLTQTKQPVKRIVQQDKIFLNGTKRGEETQKMYNLVNSIMKKSGKLFNSASKQVANKSKQGVTRLARSEFLS